MTADSLNTNITLEPYAQNVTNIKLNLDSLEGITVSNLRFALMHNGNEVFVIDTPLTVAGPGNMYNTVLSDSGQVNISNGTYNFSQTYRPQRPLSSFINADASGYWTLKIYNAGSERTGVIKSWGITISYSPSMQIPTFTGAYLPMLGNNHKFKLCDTNNVSPGGGGENVPWDFTNLIVEPNEYTDEYVEPILSPMFWHFQQSNLAKKNTILNGERYDFLRSEPYPGTFILYGNADSSFEGLKLMEYIPYLCTFRNGPITYNSMTIDSGLTHRIEPGITSNGKFMDTVRADGWGSIRLPGGVSYNNVLRILTSIASMDTVNGVIYYINNRIYSWYTTGYKFPVLRIQEYIRFSQTYGSYGFKEVIFTTENVQVNK